MPIPNITKIDHLPDCANALIAVNHNIGKGNAYNNDLIDDPGAIINNIASTARLGYTRTRRYPKILAVQGFVIIKNVEKKRIPKRKKGR